MAREQQRAVELVVVAEAVVRDAVGALEEPRKRRRARPLAARDEHAVVVVVEAREQRLLRPLHDVMKFRPQSAPGAPATRSAGSALLLPYRMLSETCDRARRRAARSHRGRSRANRARQAASTLIATLSARRLVAFVHP